MISGQRVLRFRKHLTCICLQRPFIDSPESASATSRGRKPKSAHLDLGRAADADHRDAAGELGQALLQLLTVVVRGGFLDLRLDLRNAGLDVGLLAGAVDDGGWRLGGLLLGGGQIGENAHNVAFLHDQQLLAVDRDLGAGPFAEQHAVAGLEGAQGSR